ncbi:MAG TPA: FAD-dependent oxidoreductase, partial [Gammaproteobacteria bacterium]|nr:FAD-dependent oxidoreductase [Gammaproteobacteria bacterium]
GIAGLWLHHRLRQQGVNSVLLERQAIGQGQTFSAQGIIHGGTKYALNGILSSASQAIGDMPDRWTRCLTGQGDVDLSAAKILSPHQYLWSSTRLS